MEAVPHMRKFVLAGGDRRAGNARHDCDRLRRRLLATERLRRSAIRRSTSSRCPARAARRPRQSKQDPEDARSRSSRRSTRRAARTRRDQKIVSSEGSGAPGKTKIKVNKVKAKGRQKTKAPRTKNDPERIVDATPPREVEPARRIGRRDHRRQRRPADRPDRADGRGRGARGLLGAPAAARHPLANGRQTGRSPTTLPASSASSPSPRSRSSACSRSSSSRSSPRCSARPGRARRTSSR